ncbi:MAG: SIMPL domain-containing protein, partial [Burkholderiaceae bacterium]|nr:SIMPL domain-containing protein [Burkholderiaceae bacterium]
MKRLMALIAFPLALFALPAAAQSPPIVAPSPGVLLMMTGSAEVEVPNDEAVANFFYEAQDADLAKAQGLVNQRVAEGTAALKKADPKAQVETSGYSS